MKTPEPSNENPSAPKSAHYKSTLITVRENRVLYALLNTNGWISRESIDRIAGASNGPQIIKNLRQKITGHDGIKMVRFPALDRDGRPCHSGYYQLSPRGCEQAMEYLGVKHGL